MYVYISTGSEVYLHINFNQICIVELRKGSLICDIEIVTKTM